MAETVSESDRRGRPRDVAGRRLWTDLRGAVGAGGRRRRRAGPPGHDRAARRRPRARRGRPGHRQDAARPRRRPSPRRSTPRASRARPTCCPRDVTGASLFEPGGLRFVQGPVFTNVLLVDEINRATPRTQSALLEAMQERQVSVEGTTRRLPDPFLVLATQNPVEFEGTFALPQAQLDRFLLRARIGYPDADGERRIARRYQDGRRPARRDRARHRPRAPARRPRPRPDGPRRRRGRGVRRRRSCGRPAATPTSSSAPARARPSPCTAPRRPRRCSRAASS